MNKKKELHVLYIITQLELGGAQKVCLSLFEKLRNHQTTTFLIAGQHGPLAHTVKNYSHVDLMPELQQDRFVKTIKCFFLLIKKIHTLKKKYPHLIVHTHSTTAGLLGRWAAFFAGVHTRIHTVHGYAFHEHCSYVVWLSIYMCELITSLITTHFVCVSSKDVKTGIMYFPYFNKKHSIIRAAVDFTTFYHPARNITFEKESPFIFGTVSCFKPQKNLFDLLKAFEYVHNQNNNTRLEIIGDGIVRYAIEDWIKTQKLAPVITLHGWQNSVIPHMKRWHAFTLTSLWEGLPCAIVEARLLKLPVISYDTGGITDIIFHEQNGLIYAQGEWQAFAKGMFSISQDEKLFQRIHSYKDHLTDFDNNRIAQQHMHLYKKLTQLD